MKHTTKETKPTRTDSARAFLEDNGLGLLACIDLGILIWNQLDRFFDALKEENRRQLLEKQFDAYGLPLSAAEFLETFKGHIVLTITEHAKSSDVEAVADDLTSIVLYFKQYLDNASKPLKDKPRLGSVFVTYLTLILFDLSASDDSEQWLYCTQLIVTRTPRVSGIEREDNIHFVPEHLASRLLDIQFGGNGKLITFEEILARQAQDQELIN